ncbi:MAG: hypothetical protein NC350_04295 [Corallococcus sp.]|nr:hypothetical protein [Corallococcus sp.]
MRKIFLNKKLTFLLLSLALVVVMLAAILITQLDQLASFKTEVARLEALIKVENGQIKQTTELLEYLKSNEYIREWAIEHGMLPSDAHTWGESN